MKVSVSDKVGQSAGSLAAPGMSRRFRRKRIDRALEDKMNLHVGDKAGGVGYSAVGDDFFSILSQYVTDDELSPLLEEYFAYQQGEGVP